MQDSRPQISKKMDVESSHIFRLTNSLGRTACCCKSAAEIFGMLISFETAGLITFMAVMSSKFLIRRILDHWNCEIRNLNLTAHTQCIERWVALEEDQ